MVGVPARVLRLTRVTVLLGAGVGVVLKVFQPLKRFKMRKLPGTMYKPLVGDGLEILKKDCTPFLGDLIEKYDAPAIRFWYISEPSVLIRDARTALDVLQGISTRVECNLVPWLPARERAPLDSLVLFTNGEKWSKHRQAMHESVQHKAALNAHVPAFQSCISRLIGVLDKLAEAGKPANIQSCCIAMAEDAITQAVFGVDLRSAGLLEREADAASVLASAAAALAVGSKADTTLLTPEQIEDGWWDKYALGSPEFGKRFMSSAAGGARMLWTRISLLQCMSLAFPSLMPLWRLVGRVLPDRNSRLQLKLVRGIQNGCKKLIESWRAENAEGKGTQIGLMPYVLSKSQAGGDQFSDDEILALSISAMFGGYDTTGNTLAMCLYYLAQYPEVQRQAQQEVDSVLGGKVPDANDLKKLPYVSAVIMEVLRLASPTSVAARYTMEEYVHKDGSFTIPKGVLVWFALNAYQREPAVWPRAEEFLPERHMQPGHEHLAPSDPDLFFPFAAGGRKCPGYKFALLEARLALTRLVQRFSFLPAEGYPEPVMRTSIVYMADQVMVRVSKRTGVPAPA